MPIEEQLDGWKAGKEEDFEAVCTWLWEKEKPVALHFLMRTYGLDKQWAEPIAADAFKMALEELELALKPFFPCFVTELFREKEEVVDSPSLFQAGPTEHSLRKRKAYKGRMTGRSLGDRDPFVWQGVPQFRSYFRRILIRRCQQIYRDEVPPPPPPPELADPHGPAPNGPTLGEMVEALAELAERTRGRVSQTFDFIILYIKWEVAKTCGFSDLRLEVVAGKRIEELADTTGSFDFDLTKQDLWDFVREKLGISRVYMHTITARLKQAVKELGADSPALRGFVQALRLADWRKWLEGCAATVKTLRQEGSRDLAELLKLIEEYLRCAFAEAYPRYRHQDRSWILEVPLEELLNVNSPFELELSEPDGHRFRQYVQAFHRDPLSLLARLPELHQAVLRLRPQTPLVTLIATLEGE